MAFWFTLINMVKTRFLAIFIFLFGFFAAYFAVAPFLPQSLQGFLPNIPFRLGLDLRGGIDLVYRANVSSLDKGEVDEAMAGLRDVIERRVNLFGVTEPLVQTQKSGSETACVCPFRVSQIFIKP